MAHPDGTPRLIGRELSTLHGFVGKTTVGGGALLLSGEPGVGKSALLQVAAEQAAADGIRVRSNSSNDTLDVELIIRTAIASFYTDRLAGCREALDRIARDGRESGAIASALALNMITFDDLSAGRWNAAERTAADAGALAEEIGYRLYDWPTFTSSTSTPARRPRGRVRTRR